MQECQEVVQAHAMLQAMSHGRYERGQEIGRGMPAGRSPNTQQHIVASTRVCMRCVKAGAMYNARNENWYVLVERKATRDRVGGKRK